MKKLSIKEKHTKEKALQFVRLQLEGMEYYGQNSLYYSQKRWLKLLKERMCRDIGRRQLNRDLAGFEKGGYIKRYKRHKKDGENGWVFKSTRIYIAGKGWFLAVIHDLITWADFHKRIAAIKRGGQRRVQPKEWGTGPTKPPRPNWVKTKEQWLLWKSELDPEPT